MRTTEGVPIGRAPTTPPTKPALTGPFQVRRVKRDWYVIDAPTGQAVLVCAYQDTAVDFAKRYTRQPALARPLARQP